METGPAIIRNPAREAPVAFVKGTTVDRPRHGLMGTCDPVLHCCLHPLGASVVRVRGRTCSETLLLLRHYRRMP